MKKISVKFTKEWDLFSFFKLKKKTYNVFCQHVNDKGIYLLRGSVLKEILLSNYGLMLLFDIQKSADITNVLFLAQLETTIQQSDK